MPDENYYDDSGGEQPPKSEEVSEDTGDSTALLPSSLCPGMKPGDTITLNIERVLEGQYEVSYQKEGERSEEPKPASGDDMAEMMA